MLARQSDDLRDIVALVAKLEICQAVRKEWRVLGPFEFIHAPGQFGRGSRIFPILDASIGQDHASGRIDSDGWKPAA